MGPRDAPLKTIVLDTVFPVECVTCGRELYFENNYTCAHCELLRDLAFSPLACPVCDARMPEGKICKSCRRKTVLRRFVSAGSYASPPVRELIHQFKYQRVKLFSWQLASFLLKTLETHGLYALFTNSQYDIVLVPIPLAKHKLRLRSFNQAEEIAKIVARELNLHLVTNSLIRIRTRISQTELKEPYARRENVKNAFSCPDSSLIENKIVVLIDDVYTSGATMEECGHILKEAGAKEIWGMVIAKG